MPATFAMHRSSNRESIENQPRTGRDLKSMATRIAINGFGRIGRCFLRALWSRPDKTLDVVAINDITDAHTLAHLLKYDSVHGRFKAEVSYGENAITVDGKQIRIIAERDPSKLPWKDLGVEL